MEATATPLSGGTTERLPLSDDQRAAIQDEKFTVVQLLCALPLAAGAGEAGAWLVHASIVGHLVLAVLVPPLLIAVVLWYFFSNRTNTKRDLSDGTFTRYTGPMRAEMVDHVDRRGNHSKSYYLQLGDVERLSLASFEGNELVKLSPTEGQLDFTTHTKEILELRGADGAVLYRGAGMRDVLAKRRRAQASQQPLAG